MSVLMKRSYHQVEVQGHRGQPVYKPENTIESFISAAEGGADAIEFDVMLTKDKVPIIHHNVRVNPKTTSGIDESQPSPLITDLTYAELSSLNVGGKIPPVYSFDGRIPVEAKIPTLKELLYEATTNPSMRDLNLNIEVKRDASTIYTPSEMVEEVLRVLAESGISLARVAISSFDLALLKVVRLACPFITIGMLLDEGEPLDWLIERAHAVGAQIVSPHYSSISCPDDVYRFKSLGYRVNVWSPNDPRTWDRMMSYGVNGMITDYPSSLVKFLHTKSKGPVLANSSILQEITAFALKPRKTM